MATAAQQLDQQRGIRMTGVTYPTAANTNQHGQSDIVPFSKNPGYTTVSDDALQRYQTAGLSGQAANQNAAPRDRTSRVETQYATPQAGPWTQPTVQPTRTQRLARKAGRAVGRTESWAKAKLKVSFVNSWVNGWVLFWYVTFQLPFALVSTAGLGMAYAVYESIKALPGGKELILPAVEGISRSTSSVISAILRWALEIFGFNFDPMLLFITPFALVFFFGLLQLVLCWFVYFVTNINSLSGQSAGLKNTMFVLAGIGMVIPVLNLFPLLLLWTGVVWWKPK